MQPLTYTVFITSLLLSQPKGYLEPCNPGLAIRSGPKALLRPTVGFELFDPKLTLGNLQGCRVTHLMLITALLYITPEGYQELHNEIGSSSPAQPNLLVGFKPRTFQLCVICTIPLCQLHI